MTDAALVSPPLSPASLAAAPAPAYRVVAHLAGGESIEIGSHPDETAAIAEATALMRYLGSGGGDWPFLGGRFVRPEAIVSIELTR